MFFHYLKMMFRKSLKEKSFTFITVSGLAVGFICFILILLWVKDEKSYDRFHSKVDRIYRVVDEEELAGGKVIKFTVNPPDLALTLKQDYPDILNTTRVRQFSNKLVQTENLPPVTCDISFVDPAFLDMFDFPLLSGDTQTALKGIHSILLTQKTAEKLFGQEDPLGKIVKIDNQHTVQVSGILKNIPHNSHLQFDALVPFSKLKDLGIPTDGWNHFVFRTYVEIEQDSDIRALNAKIEGIIRQHGTLPTSLSLQPLKNIHLYSRNLTSASQIGDIRYVYLFSLIGGFILLIACINFMNLSTARYSNRLKEIGLRKVVGGHRFQLFLQFMGESLFYSLCAFILAIIIVGFILPFFNNFTHKSLALSFSDWSLIPGLLGLVLLCGVFAGSYPALFLSSFRPISILKRTSSGGRKKVSVRRMLVIVQFVIATVLIVSTFTIYKQLHYIRNKKLGFDKEHLINLELAGDSAKKVKTLKSELLNFSHIVNAAAISEPPFKRPVSTILDEWEGRASDDQFELFLLSGDHDLATTLKYDLAEGRFFAQDRPMDVDKSILVNETAVKAMNMKNPVGKKLMDRQIIGVIKDFHFRSLHRPIEPLVVRYKTENLEHLLVKINSQGISQTIDFMRDTWQQLYPSIPFQFQFVDEQLDALYRSEQNIGQLATIFTGLAIFLSCLGLLGLSSFMALQRRKEFGIRKVIGANVVHLFLLLSKDFLTSVLLANLVAWPIAWYAMNIWLQNFTYRVQVHPLLFLLAGLLALFVAVFTISFQTIKVATCNPVESIRYE